MRNFEAVLQGLAVVDDEEYERREREEQQERERDMIASRLEQIPKRYVSATFDNYVGDSRLIDYLKKGRSIILHGSNGTGKTHLAFATIRHQIEQLKDAKYVLAFDFFSLIKSSFGSGDPDRIVRAYATCDYLAIDEVDKSYGSQAEFLYLYKLINDRYNDMLPTMLISNADAGSL